jgi:hypothetical protein
MTSTMLAPGTNLGSRFGLPAPCSAGTRINRSDLPSWQMRTTTAEWVSSLATIAFERFLGGDPVQSGMPCPDAGTTFRWLALPLDESAASFEIATGAHSVVGAIESIERRTGLALRTILEAAGIKRRTFYLWREQPLTAPRLASVGQVWLLLQFIDDLSETVDDIRQWLMNDARVQRLRVGDLDSLLEDAVAHRRPGRVDDGLGRYEGDDTTIVEIARSAVAPRSRPIRRVAPPHSR